MIFISASKYSSASKWQEFVYTERWLNLAQVPSEFFVTTRGCIQQWRCTKMFLKMCKSALVDALLLKCIRRCTKMHQFMHKNCFNGCTKNASVYAQKLHPFMHKNCFYGCTKMHPWMYKNCIPRCFPVGNNYRRTHTCAHSSFFFLSFSHGSKLWPPKWAACFFSEPNSLPQFQKPPAFAYTQIHKYTHTNTEWAACSFSDISIPFCNSKDLVQSQRQQGPCISLCKAEKELAMKEFHGFTFWMKASWLSGLVMDFSCTFHWMSNNIN